jgi:uncharacterized membrane protein YgcG
MTDITMCTHTGCRQGLSCYRKRAIAGHWQSYADLFEPHLNDPSIPCMNFVAIEARRNIEPHVDDDSLLETIVAAEIISALSDSESSSSSSDSSSSDSFSGGGGDSGGGGASGSFD